MNTVQPIRSTSKIGEIKRMLKPNRRDYLLFVLGINTGLRIGDLLRLQVKDVLFKKSNTPKGVLDIREEKTHKERRVLLNAASTEAIEWMLRGSGWFHIHTSAEALSHDPVTGHSRWVPTTPDKGEAEFRNAWLFKSARTNKPISRVQAYRLIRGWAEKVGITENIGAHSLRKTWGYHARKTYGVGIEEIQAKLGHRSPSVTRRYIGITGDEIAAVEDRVIL